MTTVVYIPVRGGSQSIPHKNIRSLAGRPLVHWNIRAALACSRVDHVYVASEDAEIRAIAGLIVDKRLSVIDRDPATATNEASTESALLAFAETFEFDRVVLMQATSPMTTHHDLLDGLATMAETGADSLLSVTREHRFRWRASPGGSATPQNYDPLARPRRQEWDGELYENGAFYISTRDALLQSRCRLTGRIACYEMSSETALELDEPHDWTLVEHLLANREVDSDLQARAARIELIITDVDGVLTDAGMYYNTDGDAMKKFNTRDGMGLARWRQAGYSVAIVTSEDTPIVQQRAKKLGIDRVFLGVQDKASVVRQLAEEEGLALDQVAFIGDDLNDVPALSIVGLAACPSDASQPNRACADYICSRKGGQGCVRELVDRILELKTAKCDDP